MTATFLKVIIQSYDFYQVAFYYDGYVSKVIMNKNKAKQKPHTAAINPVFSSRVVEGGPWWHCLQQQQQAFT